MLAIELALELTHCCPTGMLTVGGVSWQGNVSFAPNQTQNPRT